MTLGVTSSSEPRARKEAAPYPAFTPLAAGGRGRAILGPSEGGRHHGRPRPSATSRATAATQGHVEASPAISAPVDFRSPSKSAFGAARGCGSCARTYRRPTAHPSAHPRKAGCQAGGVGCEPRSRVTPTALREPAGPHAGWGGARGRGFPGSKCGSVRVPPQAPASAAAGWPGRARRRRRGLGPGARPRGTRCCASQLQAGPAPPRPGDPARRAGDNVRRPGGGTGSGRAACAVHFLFSARGLPPPRARPACRAAPPLAAGSLSPGRGAAVGRSGRALRLSGPRQPSRRPNFGAQPSGEPNCRGVRVCASSSLPSAPSRPEGGRAEFQARGWFILRPRIIFTHTLSHSRQIVRFGAGTGGLFSKVPSFPAPAFQITSGNLWEELTGWTMLLRFAKGRKLCHPEGDLCHA